MTTLIFTCWWKKALEYLGCCLEFKPFQTYQWLESIFSLTLLEEKFSYFKYNHTLKQDHGKWKTQKLKNCWMEHGKFKKPFFPQWHDWYAIFFFLWRNDSKLIVLLSKFAKASAVKFNRNKIVPVEETGK